MRIGIILPYFGQLPNTFNSWLHTASTNPTIDFHLITDQTINKSLASNIFVHQMSFDNLVARIRQILGTTITSPYKLCDYKPTYGHLFSDILSEYDYWGYSDLDLVYGNLSDFIQDDTIFGVYDKIFDLGHLSFYRNTPEINKLFEKKIDNYSLWPHISKSNIIWIFDELYSKDGVYGINDLLVKNNYSIYSNNSIIADVSPKQLGFTEIINNKRVRCFYSINKGELKRTYIDNNEIKEDTLIYAHFQKREITEIDTHEGIKLILPKHWTECQTYDGAITFLKTKYILDKEYNIKFLKGAKSKRRKKYFVFIKELFLYKSTIKFVTHIIKQKRISGL